MDMASDTGDEDMNKMRISGATEKTVLLSSGLSLKNRTGK